VQEVFLLHLSSLAVLSWRLEEPQAGITLCVRPLLSGRDYHALHRENPGFRFESEVDGPQVRWRPYPGVPPIAAHTNGEYAHGPDWYRNFEYDEERRRGLECVEDLASPGLFRFDLSRGEAFLILSADGSGPAGSERPPLRSGEAVAAWAGRLRDGERQRRSFASPWHRAADAYLVQRGRGKTIVAGYPWFTDWGRDTFIALRGLCLAGDRREDARTILVEWAGAVSEGMLPNRFPDKDEAPEFNSVDASLWYVVAVRELFEAVACDRVALSAGERARIEAAVHAILEGYSAGTRFGIRADADGLLAAGVPGVQLTWMDAKVDDWVVTPRIGKPVEVQALWLNALAAGATLSERWREPLERGRASFAARFWNAKGGSLYDVVDVDHQAGRVDASFRPNQILAVGGLPEALLDGERARAVVDAVEVRLLTPLGLRSLAPGEPGYCSRYEGGVRERDGAYHQGTVWPWLIGPFVEAWLRVRGGDPAAKREARKRFLGPLLRHLEAAGVGHVSEIADGDAPFTPRGCPFQAWSVGEALRLDRVVLAD
jgi:predicted glycogen debranching enzyme